MSTPGARHVDGTRVPGASKDTSITWPAWAPDELQVVPRSGEHAQRTQQHSL